jgi:hypothetical protein
MRSLDPATRDRVIVAKHAPPDILSGPRGRAASVQPLGVAVADLPGGAADLVRQLLSVYLDRLLVPVDVDVEALHFAWQGATTPGEGGHYYRMQGPDLLVEYDNTDNGANHAHTVLRRPAADFGGDILAAHRSAAH